MTDCPAGGDHVWVKDWDEWTGLTLWHCDECGVSPGMAASEFTKLLIYILDADEDDPS